MKKLLKIWANIEILNLSQQKEGGNIRCQNQIIILKIFHRTSVSDRNEKKPEMHMNKPAYLGLSILY